MIKVKDNSLNTKETVYFFCIILVGLLLRWINLDARPYHHDESLHAVYGAYNYFSPDTLYYKYTALLHGPLMYRLIPYFYEIFGTNLLSARILITLIGSIFLFVPILFRSKISKNNFLLLTTVVCISPLFVYYSRFLREDFLVLSTMIGMTYAITVAQSKFKAGLFFIFLSLHYCIKENVFITMALLLGFLIYDFALSVYTQKTSALKKVAINLKENAIYAIIGLGIAIFIFCYYYSAQFRNPELILNGLYKDSLLYWLNQHNIERIKGPFSFQFLMLTFYDFYFVLLILLITGHQLLKEQSKLKYIPIALIMITLLLSLICKEKHFETFIYSFFKLKIPLDIFICFLIIILSVATTTMHWLRGNVTLAWFSYLFWATFFSYSYVGEKVPWLSLYPLFTGLIYALLYIEDNFIYDLESKYLQFIFALLILFTIRISIMTNFDRAGSHLELISQVHTTQDFHQIMVSLKEKMKTPLKKDSSTLITQDAVWPATWYLFNENDFHFYNQYGDEKKYRYIIRNDIDENLASSHEHYNLKLRGWWVPEYDKLSFKLAMNYIISHHPWNPSGFSHVYLYIRKQKP